jgi:hypothetical protein
MGHATPSRTALVATASPEAMQLLRDAAGLGAAPTLKEQLARVEQEPLSDSLNASTSYRGAARR